MLSDEKQRMQIEVKLQSIDIIVRHLRKTPETSMYFYVCKKKYPASTGQHILLFLVSFES